MAAKNPAHWRAAAWQLERWDPARYGRRRRVELSGMVPLTEVKALLVAVVELVERWVPEHRREAELSDLIAVAEEVAARGPEPLRVPGALSVSLKAPSGTTS